MISASNSALSGVVDHDGVAQIGTAMHDAMRYRAQVAVAASLAASVATRVLPDPLHQLLDGGLSIGSVGESDALDRTLVETSRRRARFEQRKLDARGAGIDRKKGAHGADRTRL